MPRSISFLALALVLVRAPARAESVQDRLAVYLRRASGTLAGEPLGTPAKVAAFYRARSGAPAWLDGTRPGPEARALLDAIRDSRWDGLSPGEYHLEPLETLVTELATAETTDGTVLDTAAAAEILLTDAFCSLGEHLARGRLTPASVNADWAIRPERVAIPRVLEQALASHDVAGALRSLAPRDDGYRKLREALKTTVRPDGCREPLAVAPGPPLRPGARGARVAALAARLADACAGPLPVEAVYDAALERQVAAFQSAHGLRADGVAGRATLEEINVPRAERRAQLVVNLERLRWLPDDLGDRYVLVDIAGFSLTLFDGGKPRLSMRIIVGKDHRETPVFSGAIKYVVLNPTWAVPRSIAVEEILPAAANDPTYFARKGLRVFEEQAGRKTPIDPAGVDWASVPAEGFAYSVEQPAGPRNPLGSVKFVFPNDFAVYLHGTPDTALFDRGVRTLSHGCIRVESPVALAEALLEGTKPPWTARALQEAIALGRERALPLPRPTPVHLWYRTAWVDEQNTLQFRHDVYGWDRTVWDALNRIYRIAAF